MYYYNKLGYGLKQFFNKLNFEPENKFEADAFLRSHFDVDANKTLVVNLKEPVIKNGEQYKTVIANKKDFLDLFYVDIWKQLDMGQKLQAITFAYKNIIETETDLLNNPPQILFNCENCGYRGVFYSLKNKLFVEISVQNLERDEKHPLTWLATLRHELYHCQQDILISNLSKKIIANNKNGIKNNLDNYQTNLLISNYDYVTICNDIAKYKNDLLQIFEQSKNKNKNDYELVKYWQSIRYSEDWSILLGLFYYVQDMEVASYNKGATIVSKANKYFWDNFDGYQKYSTDNANEILQKEIRRLNKEYNFNLTYDDIDEFKNINMALTAGNLQKNKDGIYNINEIYVDKPEFFNTINWKMMKRILKIYKNKKVKSKLADKDVKVFKNTIDYAIDDTINF